MKNTLETRLGIFFALALIAAFIILEMVGTAGLLRKGKHVHAQFNTVQDLKVGDPVKMAGKQIGAVESIDFADNKVDITMKIVDPKAVLRTDSKAAIRFLGLLGQNYVAINFGSATAPAVDSGALLETTEQPDLSALMAKLDNVATGIESVSKSFSGDNFSNLLEPFTDFMKENKEKITIMLGNLQNISTRIAEGKGTVGKMINDDTLYTSALGAVTNLNDVSAEIKLTINEAKTVITNINSGQGTLGKLAKDEALYRETTNAMTNLREILQKINQGQGSVGKLVNDDSLFKNAKMTLQKLDKATEGLEDQGPLSVLGIAVNSLF